MGCILVISRQSIGYAAGTVTSDSSGNGTFTGINLGTQVTAAPVFISIDASGIITDPTDPTVHGVMSQDKILSLQQTEILLILMN